MDFLSSEMRLLGCAPTVISDNELINIAIESSIDVSALDITTSVLDQSIGIQYIVTYLAAKRVIHLLALELSELSSTRLLFSLIELTAQDAKSGFFVLEL